MGPPKESRDVKEPVAALAAMNVSLFPKNFVFRGLLTAYFCFPDVNMIQILT